MILRVDDFKKCVTASITDGIVTCNLDEGDGAAIINLTMHECSALIATYNSIN